MNASTGFHLGTCSGFRLPSIDFGGYSVVGLESTTSTSQIFYVGLSAIDD